MTSQPSLTRERAFTLLAKSQRRYLLSLLQADGKRDVETLARQIAAMEADETVAAVHEESARRTHVSLIHNHLPRLEDHDVIAYDRESGEVELQEGIDELEPLLERTATIPPVGTE